MSTRLFIVGGTKEVSMFGFFDMAFNYESRKVANTVIGGATIDTAAVTDSARPYETGIAHPDYNGGSWIIVELYDSKEQAELGHAKWVKIFSRKRLPPHLIDVNESELQNVAKAIGSDLHGIFKRNVPQKRGSVLTLRTTNAKRRKASIAKRNCV